MADQKIHVDFTITNDLASARLDGNSGITRSYALAFFSVLTIIGMCLLLFLPGKGGSPSVWHSRSASFDLVLTFPLFMFFLTKRYVRLAYPPDETFSCDRSTLTTARVRWFDFRDGNWDSSSFPLAEVREIKYRVLVSMRGMSVYGLRFKVGNKTLRVLPWLKPAEAERILLALKSFGADVPDDPVVPSKLKEDQWGN